MCCTIIPSLIRGNIIGSSMKMYYGLSNSYKMSDGDYYARASFICNTMLGSGSEAKCFVRDYLPFMDLITFTRMLMRFIAM